MLDHDVYESAMHLSRASRERLGKMHSMLPPRVEIGGFAGSPIEAPFPTL